MEDLQIIVTQRNADQNGDYNLCHFWSNFEIGDLRFFRSEAYLQFFNNLDRCVPSLIPCNPEQQVCACMHATLCSVSLGVG